MKTKNNKRQSYFRLHHRGIMLITAAVLLFCLFTFNRRFTNIMRQAYLEGFGAVGAYAREGEMIRYPVNLGVNSRIQAITGF